MLGAMLNKVYDAALWLTRVIRVLPTPSQERVMFRMVTKERYGADLAHETGLGVAVYPILDTLIGKGWVACSNPAEVPAIMTLLHGTEQHQRYRLTALGHCRLEEVMG
jgi:hypothetical protein